MSVYGQKRSYTTKIGRRRQEKGRKLRKRNEICESIAGIYSSMAIVIHYGNVIWIIPGVHEVFRENGGCGSKIYNEHKKLRTNGTPHPTLCAPPSYFWPIEFRYNMPFRPHWTKKRSQLPELLLFHPHTRNLRTCEVKAKGGMGRGGRDIGEVGENRCAPVHKRKSFRLHDGHSYCNAGKCGQPVLYSRIDFRR